MIGGMSMKITEIITVIIALTIFAGCTPINHANNSSTITKQDSNSSQKYDEETTAQTMQIDTAISTDPSATPALNQSETQPVSKSIIYTNTQYGFKFTLPESWGGYTIIVDKWNGVSTGGSQPIETGPIVSIRHPLWTANNPRQDIPIMIFTLTQWKLLQQEKFHIGAAPIGPSELGRNSSYVFALPARYNFAFLTGYEEVENILNNNPLQPIDNK